MSSQWIKLITSLDAPDAVKNFGKSLQLVRIDREVIHLKSQERVTRSGVEKLASALSSHTGQPVCLLLRHGPHGTIHRCYRDNKEGAPCQPSNGAVSNNRTTS